MSQNSLSNKELSFLDDVFDVFGETESDETPTAVADAAPAPVITDAVIESFVPTSTTPPDATPVAPVPVAASPAAPAVNPSVVAPTPVTPTAVAPSPDVVEAASDTDAATDGDQQQTARREPNGYRWLAAGVAAGVAAFVMLQGPNPLGSVQAQALSDPAGAVSATLVDAKQWYAEYGTYTGFTGVDGTDVAAGGPVMIVTAGSGSSCTYAGIAPQHETVISGDATGAHCAPERLAALRVDLANL